MTTGDRILELLPATRAQLRAELRVAKATLHKWLTRLRAEGKIHVGKYNRTLGDFAPVYMPGPGKDVKRPKAIPHKEIARRYRTSLMELGIYEDVLADQRKRNSRKTGRKKSYADDPLLSLLFKKPN